MPDDDRTVDLSDDFEILPDNTRDDTDAGWGESRSRSARRRIADQRLLDERPPHWELRPGRARTIYGFSPDCGDLPVISAV